MRSGVWLYTHTAQERGETAPKLKLGSYRLGPVGRLYAFLGDPGSLLNALPVRVGEELAGTFFGT